MPFLIRLLVNAAALWVATRLVPGVSFDGGTLPFLGVALVFGVVNAFVRPLMQILTFPLILVTLGILPARRQRVDAVAHELAVGVARPRVSRGRLLGGVLGRDRRQRDEPAAVDADSRPVSDSPVDVALYTSVGPDRGTR